jgi:potassium efflux system protein
LADTLLVISGAVLLHSLAERWLTVLMPKLALSRAQAKREAVAAAKARKDAGEGAPENLVISEVNLATIGRHTKRWLSMLIVVYLIVALALVWYELFPALRVLEEVELWNYETKVDGVEQLVPITLWDLVLAVLIAVLAVLVSRNLPGVLEITVLKHLSLLDAGMRYAITYLSRYGILTAGIVLFFKFIGVGWGQLQWLIAALSVGLGFGLREIFADYVSGLIILFERPMRVGDTVTVGGVNATHGTVSRIRIRTTTVTDWDNKELVIPNKAFVTDQLINWTLSSPVTRVIVPVRIAFGSDTTLAHKVMLEVAKSNPLVLEDPEPTVLFLGFGDNSFDFEVRAFVRESSQRLILIHELHMAVERALREHDIEIPYPQRDVHLHAVDSPLNPPAIKPHKNSGFEE